MATRCCDLQTLPGQADSDQSKAGTCHLAFWGVVRGHSGDMGSCKQLLYCLDGPSPPSNNDYRG